MNRLAFVLSIFALIVATASPVVAKVVNVTNPMSADLDANQHIITNANEIDANLIVANTKLFTNGTEILAGSENPAAGVDATVGALYLRRAPDAQGVAHGSLWFKLGIFTTDWTCVAGCSP